LTYGEARDLQYALKDRASQWTLVTILASGISGAIPNPGTLAAASASALMALGNDWVAGQIDRHITSKGVSMKIQWLPYPGLIIRGTEVIKWESYFKYSYFSLYLHYLLV